MIKGRLITIIMIIIIIIIILIIIIMYNNGISKNNKPIRWYNKSAINI